MKKHKSPSPEVQKYTVGEMGVNCYFVVDAATRDALIIDPGDGADYLAGELEKQKIHPVAIVATHGHFDHILAALELQLIYKIPFRMSAADEFLLDRMNDSAEHFLGRKIVELPPKVTDGLRDGETLSFGKSSLSVISTPGHTPGGISLLAKDYGIFVGDTIFAGGGVGRTDFSYSSASNLQTSIQKILQMPENSIIYSGHGEETTVKIELTFHTI